MQFWFIGDFAELDEYLNSHIGYRDGEYNCTLCGKNFGRRKTDAKIHIEAKHLENHQVSCKLCGFLSKSRDSLRKHVKSHHRT